MPSFRYGRPGIAMKIKNNFRNLTSVVFPGVVALLFLSVAGLASGQSKALRPGLSERISKVAISPKAAGKDRVQQIRPARLPGAPVDATSYAFATSTSGSFTDMSSGTTQLLGAGLDDSSSAVTNIGFDFYMLGVRYTQFSASSNGYIRLGSTAVTGTTYTLGGASTALITALGSDEITAVSGGKVHYKVTGSAPNRVLTVEFRNMTVIYDGAGATGDCTDQVRLHETTGQVELVYGSMNRNTSAGFQNGMDPQFIGFSFGSTAGTFNSVDTNNNNSTAVLTANQFTLGAAMASLDSPGGDGTRRVYAYTPTVPTAPTNLTFTSVTPISMALNWADSPDENLYAIFRSTDGVNYTFIGTAAQNATSFNAVGLNPSTNYFWQVFAISDGALSGALVGSQVTTAPGVVTSTAAGGNWSDTATWVGGNIPTTTDDVTIVSGATVTIDTAAAALDVTVNSGGILQWDTTTARTLTLGASLAIDSGGTFNSGATGTIITHVLTVGGNLTNNGTLDFSTNSNTAGAGIVFTGSTSNTFGGTGGTTNIRTLTVNKGAITSILELNSTNFTVQGTTTDGTPMAFLTLTSGTLKISGTFSMTGRVFTTANYTIGTNAGFWLNNPNFTVAGQASAAAVSGLFRVTQGTFNIGTASNNALGFNANSTIIVEGGTINSTGRFAVASAGNAVNYTQSGGVITVCTLGNTSTTLANFDLGTSANSNIAISAGTVVVVLHSSGIDYRLDSGGTLDNITGGTLQMGNANSGSAKAFSLRGVFYNLVIDNTSAGHSATMSTTLVNWNHVSLGNITINTGNTFNIGSAIFLMYGDMLNNGTFTGTGASSRYYHAADVTQTYAGNGVMTAPLTSFEVDNPGGVNITATNQQVVGRIILFTGGITGANKLTLGNGAATTGIVQIGNAGSPATDAGGFDVPMTFNLGSGGEVISYGNYVSDRSTGGEINPARTLTTLSFDTGGPNLTIAGGDLMVTGTTTIGTASPNGRIITGINNLIIGSAGSVSRVAGSVDGNLVKNYAATGSKVFEVGTANGYSPVTVNMTAGAPAPFLVKATQTVQPNIPNPTQALQRYWTLAATGVTADLTFNYLDPTDIPGTANESNFSIFKYDGSLTMPGGSVNTVANTATITGVSSFSDWTLAEPATALTATGAVSRKTHGGAGDFDINLPLSGPVGVECRAGGGNYQMLISFASSVTFNSASVSSGTGSVGSTSGGGTNTITVDLTGVTNAQVITVTLFGATDGMSSGDISVSMGMLLGDTNGNGAVSSADISQTKGQSGQTANGSNFRTDVNANGSVSSADISLVKAASGSSLP